MPRRLPLNELDARRIALLKPSALGDIVHSLPILHALRRRFPGAAITWVVSRPFEPLLRGHPDLTDTLAFDRRGGWRSMFSFAQELYRRRFDLVIDLQGLLRTGLMAGATRATRRVGLSTAREGSHWFATDTVRVADADAMHAVDRYWLVAEALGAGHVPKTFHVPVDEMVLKWVDELLAPLPRPWLVVSPGSRWLTKRWPPLHFAELVRRATREFGGSAIAIGSPDEAALTGEVAVATMSLDLGGRTSLPQLVALLSRADAVIANDSGPLHLAAALGRPVVAPYTCTSVRRHGPYGQRGAIETGVWCRGSYRKHCSRLECMAELTPERLWPVLAEVLARCPSLSRSA